MKMFRAVAVPRNVIPWTATVLERTKGSSLARGDVVLIIGDKETYEILQGTVSGLTESNVRVAVSSTRELVFEPQGDGTPRNGRRG